MTTQNDATPSHLRFLVNKARELGHTVDVRFDRNGNRAWTVDGVKSREPIAAIRKVETIVYGRPQS